MQTIFKAFDRLMRLDEDIASLALFGLFVVAIANVFMRYLFSSPLAWSEEILQLLMVWATFLGASAMVRRNEHVLIGLLNERLPATIARWNTRVFNIGIIMLCALAMLFWGLELLPFSRFRSTPMLRIPYYWIHVAVPISAIMMLYHSLVRLITDDRSVTDDRDAASSDATPDVVTAKE
ncbi:TRAP-type C4-dicarboxylate transport system permease small subunit [Chromohalobacter marismortui]|uniref:TRAP transporter small permease protein n=1 Tax=Chromohalobacter marismortui TaxID=42055 RepID=A0A4R7NXD3_9GAMM|nr:MULTISPECIES: TRAP transporter small permease [Chromohalobacter]MCI0511165.1 TRAP transporter small permease [Chromohalobacter sp.]MCI0593599.1 TRAP transporter small permease [Chromohalobacter sp.]TDU25190.1 TRAP-type C4-dicarboxylate transport system permease small subunit [Chromohalobacter marismortui]